MKLKIAAIAASVAAVFSLAACSKGAPPILLYGDSAFVLVPGEAFCDHWKETQFVLFGHIARTDTEEFFDSVTVEGVKYCLEIGTDPNETNDRGETPLHYVVSSRNLQAVAIVKVLLDAGADPDAAEAWRSILYYAATSENPQAGAIVKLLLDAGASSELQTGDGRTLLHDALRVANPEVLKLLIEVGADVNAKDPREFGETPLHAAAKITFDISSVDGSFYYPDDTIERAPEVVKLLIEAGADVDARDEHGSTPLHAATWNSNPEVLKVLIEAGADPTAQDDYGDTPLRDAMEHGTPEVVKLLREAIEEKQQ